MGAVSDLFSIGRSALNAYSTALATTSHNVANAATPGFSRQRVDFATQTPTGVLGNGAVDRARGLDGSVLGGSAGRGPGTHGCTSSSVSASAASARKENSKTHRPSAA